MSMKILFSACNNLHLRDTSCATGILGGEIRVEGWNLLNDEESTYFSGFLVVTSCSSLTSSTSSILFCVSIGKRWRGILCPVSSPALSGKRAPTASWLPRDTGAAVAWDKKQIWFSAMVLCIYLSFYMEFHCTPSTWHLVSYWHERSALQSVAAQAVD